MSPSASCPLLLTSTLGRPSPVLSPPAFVCTNRVTSSVSSVSIHSFFLPGRSHFLKVTSLPFRQVSSADPDDILGQEGISRYTVLYGGENTEGKGLSPRSQSWFAAGKCLTEHKGA